MPPRLAAQDRGKASDAVPPRVSTRTTKGKNTSNGKETIPKVTAPKASTRDKPSAAITSPKRCGKKKEKQDVIKPATPTTTSNTETNTVASSSITAEIIADPESVSITATAEIVMNPDTAYINNSDEINGTNSSANTNSTNENSMTAENKNTDKIIGTDSTADNNSSNKIDKIIGTTTAAQTTNATSAIFSGPPARD